jgi:phosphate/phosphite/phosphonate ABC transporter binding protein
MKRNFFAVTVIVFAALTTWVWSAHGEEKRVAARHITIGVLARDGKLKAMKQWTATGEYLTAHIGRPVSIAPLDFKEIMTAVKTEKIDFFIINPSMFVTAQIRYSAVPVVTMKSSGNDSFGGVIFTAAANKGITDRDSLKGKKFGAVEKSSLGGWQMALKEFDDAGTDAYNFFSTLRFFGTHSAVVKAVLSRQVHAGTVRTGTLERMAKNGEINMDQITILEEKYHAGFPLAVSTALYPEWVLARTPSTDTDLADSVATALKYLTEEAKASVDAQCTGWAAPWDYSSVEELQRQLQVGAYKKKK